MAARSERRFRAMGCDVHLVVWSDATVAALERQLAAALDEASVELERLEALWSRFRPSSELSRLNRAGAARDLHPETYALIEDAVEAWRITDARFDPTVHDALVAAGYDRTFDDLPAVPALAGPSPAPPPDDRPTAPPPGPVGITFDPDTRSIALPEGVHLDLGGIGKGRAADLLSARLIDQGMTGVCVNLGGDVRVRGPGPDGPWVIAVEDPFDGACTLTTVALDEGAVATSARTRRRWRGTTGEGHHLIDPATGRPAARGLAAVTVIAQDAEWAEVLAKAAFVAGPEAGADLVVDAGAVALLVTDEGTVMRTEGFEAFAVEPA